MKMKFQISDKYEYNLSENSPLGQMTTHGGHFNSRCYGCKFSFYGVNFKGILMICGDERLNWWRIYKFHYLPIFCKIGRRSNPTPDGLLLYGLGLGLFLARRFGQARPKFLRWALFGPAQEIPRYSSDPWCKFKSILLWCKWRVMCMGM
jgi:hypothetical protein